MSRDQRIIELTIECFELPAHDWGGHTEIWLGIQCGKAVVQEVKLPVQSAVFGAELRVGPESADARPNFLGQYAQGPAESRFVYLCWGARHGGAWVGFRRAKLPLSGLTWDDVALNRLHAKVRCTDAKGGPICATLKDESVTWIPSGAPLPFGS